jgi:hypothetical protein
MKTKAFFALLSFIYSFSALGECKDLNQQLDNYETACKVTTDLTSSCGLISTATATYTFGLWGLLCAIPSVVGSGVCALRDIKQRLYDSCVEGLGTPAWTKTSAKAPKNKQQFVLLRNIAMNKNNEDYEKKVDTFLDNWEGTDFTTETNKEFFDNKMAQFEEEYVAQAKEIQDEFQKNILK